MALLQPIRKWLQRKQYHFEVTFSIYMFTPWEKFTFYSISFLLISLTFIAAILYLPHHIAILSGRAMYYIKGEDIDVAASAREVVKEMSAGIMQGYNGEHDAAAAVTTTVTEEIVRTAVKEL